MALEYTTTLPTKVGFYFAKCVGMMSGKAYETVVKVYSTVPGVATPNCIYAEGDNHSIDSDQFTAFAGPIELPKDSKVFQ